MFVITAPPTERTESVEQVLDIKGVIDVRETLTGQRNIYVEAVGTTTGDVTRISDSIHNLGLEIESSNILKQHRTQPFNHFHYEGNLVGAEVEDSDG